MLDTINLRGFEVTYLGATNNKGSRVKIRDLRHYKTKMIPYNHNFNHIGDMAKVYLKNLGIEVLYCCESEKGYILLSNNFDIMIK